MEVAEAPSRSCIIFKAEELSMAIMEEEEEQEEEGEQAYEEAVCEGKLMESMQSLRPLLVMREEGTSSESSLLNAYDLEQDILLSCDDLSPPYQDTWSLDPLRSYQPSHSNNPTWLGAISFEETGKHSTLHQTPNPALPSCPPLLEFQSHENDLPNSVHSFSPCEEVALISHKGFSVGTKQVERDCTKHVERADSTGTHRERDRIKRGSKMDEANSGPNSLNGDARKRLLDGERKWPHLHSFLKSCSNKSSLSTSSNGDARRNDSSTRVINTSSNMSYKDHHHRSYNANDAIRNGHTNKSFRSSKGVKKAGFFKVSSLSESLKQHEDSSENAYNYSEDEGSEKMSSRPSKGSMSKNLVSERKRRQRLNERLYSLRALVPTISKMDKASIVGDAINYVRDLQEQVVKMEEDVAHLEVTKEAIANGLVDTAKEPKRIRHAMDFDGVKTPRQQHQIVELDVTHMEHQLYQFRIHCKKSPGVLLQLTRALESLEFEIVNANLTSINDHILNTLVIEVANAHLTRSEDVRKRTLEVIPKFGLFVSNTYNKM